MTLRFLFPLVSAAFLASCDAIYQTSDVMPGVSQGAKVRVLPITPQNVLLANRSAYTPQQLPAVFAATAGAGSGMIGAGSLPDAPYTEEQRPGMPVADLPPQVTPQPYEIGIGDVVILATPSGDSIAELSGLLAAQNSRQGYTVQDDGAIAIPNVGRVAIAGMNVEDAEAVLFQRLVEAQVEPTFSLEIAEFNSKKVSIGGAVNQPGVAPITLSPLYLDQALAGAGGVTVPDMDYAVVRLYRDGNLYQIPLDDLYSRSGMQRIRLVAGDSVFVDNGFELDQAQAYFEQQIRLSEFRLDSRATALASLTNEINLRRQELTEARSNYLAQVELDAVDRDYAYIVGQVNDQSRYTLPLGRQGTLADALYDEGGGLDLTRGNPRQIYVLRGSDDPMDFDAVTAWRLDGKNAAALMLATRFELRPNDVIFVSEQPVSKWNRAITMITPSIISLSANAASGD
ncbi:polysaccharide biosynthesis/export family protein [Celeribacter indicus]|uniref:Putative polysaccharide biosynthesis/export protein n=1 Tax=Celeribacter indicus TaxID=1208324 RepID=A0A0B5E095_9RHOB|nr:polysaccharide biosynthesis/export family protein [Celeribacter indicus]AJE45882.1 putative polysaccharide biosynthesis/export protein [Celeribacter indicus]SDW62913.1 polysaccharide export outer membrane protein [Celeribacter indicus]